MKWAGDREWPDWCDEGRVVRVISEEGLAVIGVLDIGDFFPDGEGGEIPIFSVIDEHGASHSFAGARCWRYEIPRENDSSGVQT